MKIRIMSVEEDLITFSNFLKELELEEKIQIISSSKPYPNRNSIEVRGYVDLKILNKQSSRIPGIELNKKIKIEIIREDSVIFTLYVNSEAEAKEFVRYFNVNISNCDEAITEDK